MNQLVLHGCRENQLKGFDIAFTKGAMTALVGVSGSGKTSLAMGIIYNEAQRRFLPCLSPALQQSIKAIPQPLVDLIEGLSPCLALGQGRGRLAPSTTIGQYTDNSDLLGLLFSRCGTEYDANNRPISAALSRQEIVHRIQSQWEEGARLEICSLLPRASESMATRLDRLQSLGFVRFLVNGQEWRSGDTPPPEDPHGELLVIVDRLLMRKGTEPRLTSSVETALNLSQGILIVRHDGTHTMFSEHMVDPITGEGLPPLSPRHFSSTHALGACTGCSGTGGWVRQLAGATWENCTICSGTGLMARAHRTRWRGRCWLDLQSCSLSDLYRWLQGLQELNPIEQELIPKILERLEFLLKVGMSYVSLGRRAITLSEGEDHRVQLASHIGAKLSGIIYILDGPSIGLHDHDLKALAGALGDIVALDNTVIVLDHHPKLLRDACAIYELGPGAGPDGGQLIFQGDLLQLRQADTPTGVALARQGVKPSPRGAKPMAGTMTIKHASVHNLKGFDVTIPMQQLVVICGVSGSGKSSLALDLLLPSVKQWLQDGSLINQFSLKGKGLPDRLVTTTIDEAIRTPRSTVATYIGLMAPLRTLFSQTKLARSRGYTVSRFSLNRKGGRCETCEGYGERRIRLELLADLWIPCEICRGARYSAETLQCQWNGLSISDILDFSVEQAVQHFALLPLFEKPLALLMELGLGYLKLGRALNKLSWGELQRLRLGAELHQKGNRRTIYLLDEPCGGLHPTEVHRVAQVLQQLVAEGHSAVVIDHDLAMIAAADYVIELGPKGGPEGGQLIFTGSPTQLLREDTPTARALRDTVC